MCNLCNISAEEVRKRGIIFGYPDCCIEEFIRDTEWMEHSDIDVRNEAQISIAKQTAGFVPCKMHTEMILNGQTTPEDLVVKRRNIKKAKKLNRIAHID